MRTFITSLAVFALCSCGPFIDAKKGIVSTGFLSSTQAFSGKLKASDGSSATWSVVGHDGTSVANNALGTISTVAAAKSLLQTRQSDNAVTNFTTKTNGTTSQLKITTDAATKQAAINAAVPK